MLLADPPQIGKTKGIARYAGLHPAPLEGFDLRPRLFLPFGGKRAFHAICAYLRPVLVFSSNLPNF